MKAAVLGGAGYAGGELLRLLHGHPQIKSVIATSRSQAGKKLGEVHPQLAALTDATFLGLTPVEAAQKAEVVFLALEHGESGKVVPELLNLGPKMIIDIAADFRTSDRALYEKYYGKHPNPELLGKFTYALADVLGQSLKVVEPGAATRQPKRIPMAPMPVPVASRSPGQLHSRLSLA